MSGQSNSREHPDVTAQRHAAALAEVHRMRQDHDDMRLKLAEAEREVDRLRNMVEVLRADKDTYRHSALLFQRKLMRLCGAMSALGKLSEEAVAVMKDAKEYEELLEAQERKKEEGDAATDERVAEVAALLRGANGH